MFLFKQVLVTAVLIASGVVGSAAAAAEERMSQQRVVSYSDLDLNVSSGVDALYGRLRLAARSVCGYASPLSVQLQFERRACRRASLEDAVMRLGHPDVVARHFDRVRSNERTHIADTR